MEVPPVKKITISTCEERGTKLVFLFFSGSWRFLLCQDLDTNSAKMWFSLLSIVAKKASPISDWICIDVRWAESWAPI